MKQVDTHAHIFALDSAVVTGARYRPDYEASVENYIDYLNKFGFDYGVLIQPSFLGTDNSQMLAAIAAYPDRLKGVAVVSEDTDISTLRELQMQGIVGARLNLFGQPLPDLQQPEWQAFLTNLTKLGWQLELHCPPDYLRQLMVALENHPGPIVIDHFGRITPENGVTDPHYQAVLELLDPTRYWVKISGYYRLGTDDIGITHATEALALLLEKNLENRLVWGSDWPHTQHEHHITYNDAFEFMHTLLHEPVLRHKVLVENPQTLYGFEP